MDTLVDILKSRGKLGGVGLMALGVGYMAMVYFGKIQGDYSYGGAMFLAGLSLLGIRGAMDTTPEPPK